MLTVRFLVDDAVTVAACRTADEVRDLLAPLPERTVGYVTDKAGEVTLLAGYRFAAVALLRRRPQRRVA